jgi:hypothetical protein
MSGPLRGRRIAPLTVRSSSWRRHSRRLARQPSFGLSECPVTRGPTQIGYSRTIYQRERAELKHFFHWRGVCLVLAASLLSACGGTALLESPLPEEAPLFRRIDARVGTVYTGAARSLIFYTVTGVRVELGKASVASFERAFAAMFRQTTELPDWPPWRDVGTAMDGVIELEWTDGSFVAGAPPAKPEVVEVSYRICLYEPDGSEIRCWSPSARISHERFFEPFISEPYVGELTETAIRKAIARFMVQVENDPAVKAWAARVARKGATQ